MVKSRTFQYIWLCVLLIIPMTMVRAQVMDTGHKVDTLSTAERLSLRSNAVDWLLLVPNVGIEYDILSTNWNRWSVGLNLRYNWQTSHTYKPGLVYNVAEARLEVRTYYRIRVFIVKASLKIAKIAVYEKDNTIYTYSIEQFKSDIPLDDKLFVFDKSKYPGVEVNDMR